jgi:MFS family permease
LVIKIDQLRSVMLSESPRKARWATSLLFVVDGTGFGVWAAHIPAFKESLSLSSSALSLVLLALVLGSLLTMPVTGQVVARFGSRRVVWLSVTVYLGAIWSLSRATDFWFLIVAVALFGAAKGGLDVSINAQGVWVERQLGKLVMSSFQGFWSVGGLLGATLSSLALRYGKNAHQDFLFTALALSLCSVIAGPMLLKEVGHESKARTWKAPDRGLLELAAIAFLGLFAEGAMADWDGVYLKTSVGVSLSQAAIGYAVFSVAMAVGRFVGDAVIARFSPRTILRVSGFMLFVGVSFTLTLNVWWAALLGFVSAGFGLSNIVPVVWGVAGRNQRIGAGPALATVTTVGYFGFLAGPPLIGAVATFLNVRYALIIVALLGIAIAFSASTVSQAAE